MTDAGAGAADDRLSSLVTLLQAVGLSDITKDDMDRVSRSLAGGGGAGGGAPLSETQIELLIRRLQAAQEAAPEKGANGSRQQPQHPQHHQQPQQKESRAVDEDDSDSFDEDADYPMVGHGVSDDVSIVSDLTTPTVVSSLHVPEEEHYRDGSLPPMMILGDGNAPSMLIAPPKRKNLVQPQRAGGVVPPTARRASTATGTTAAAASSSARHDRGGAASARLRNYQTTMAKLSDPVPRRGIKKPAVPAAPPAAASPTASAALTRKRVPSKKKTEETFSNAAPSRGGSASDIWNTTSIGSGNNTSAKAPAKRRGLAGKTPIDDDGFLVDDAFDAFDAASNPFKSSAGDLEFGTASDPFRADFDAFGSFGLEPVAARPSAAAAAKPRVKKPTQQSAGLQRKAPTHTKSADGGRPRRTRRASAVS